MAGKKFIHWLLGAEGAFSLYERAVQAWRTVIPVVTVVLTAAYGVRYFPVEWVILISLFFGIVVSIFLGAICWVYHQLRRAFGRGSNIELVFPYECNAGGKESKFKRSYSILATGLEIKKQVSFHSFYLGVHNKSLDKTARGVCLHVDDLNMPPRVIGQYLMIDGTKDIKTSIPPRAGVYFLLGSGWDQSADGMLHPCFVGREEYESIIDGCAENTRSRFSITSSSLRIPLLRNNGYKLTISLYADDVPYKEYVVTVNAKDKIEIFPERTRPVNKVCLWLLVSI